MMYDTKRQHFIHCDTCPEYGAMRSRLASSKAIAKILAEEDLWEIRDGLHRCPQCVREGRTEMVK